VAPLEADLHRLAVHHFVAGETAAPAGPGAFNRRIEVAWTPARCPPDPPDPGPGIKQPEREPFKRLAASRRISPDPVHMAKTIENGLGTRGGAELYPFGAVRVSHVGQFTVVHPPVAENKIEICSSVSNDGCRFCIGHDRSSYVIPARGTGAAAQAQLCRRPLTSPGPSRRCGVQDRFAGKRSW
jgi:hypothetical protein